VVVAIIGIIAAIALPNLLNAVDRGKQKRSMADMRTIGTAIEAYATDHNYYPIQATPDTAMSVSLARILQPYYTQVVPMTDGWDRPILYGTLATGPAYTLRSLGKDGVKNGGRGATAAFDCDIVFQAGRFTSWPEGIQS
jgi:general secretion pathway protein G